MVGGEEDRLAAVAALGDLVRCAGDDDAGEASHEDEDSRAERARKLVLCPRIFRVPEFPCLLEFPDNLCRFLEVPRSFTTAHYTDSGPEVNIPPERRSPLPSSGCLRGTTGYKIIQPLAPRICMIRFLAIFSAIALGSAAPVLGADLEQQAAALKEIRATAADICQVPPVTQESRSVKLTAAANAKLAGVVKRVANIGLSGSADYRKEYSSGVLQKDLAHAIEVGTNCRLSVFTTLQAKMVRNISPPPPPKSIIKSVPNNNSRLVTRFNKPTGYFKKVGKFWIEYPELAPGQNFRFIETGQDADYVYMTDLSRSKPGSPENTMLVRLPKKGGSAQWSWQNPILWVDFTVVFPVAG